MPASYPGSIKTFTTKTDLIDTYDAAHINDPQLEITAIETELGTDVAGSATDLKTRLAVSLADSGAIKQGTAFPGSPVEGQLFWRTDLQTLYAYSVSAAAWKSAQTLSNYLFQYSGNEDGKEYAGNSLNPAAPAANYRFLFKTGTGAGSYSDVWRSKFRKISGINTVTVYGRIWGESGPSVQANIKVDVGGQNNNVSGTSVQLTPEWVSMTIDVSSLSDNTVYDVTASLQNISGSIKTVYCSNIVAF